MRYARPHALSEDGQRLIVETDDGEQIAILADAQLRQLLRGDRPRPQLEIEMDTGLTPREIQTRIRAGASVEELADASGMPSSRIEAFAAPVMAEREHIATMAQNGSVRRRGEPTGHRTLQAAIGDRLRERGVDPSSVAWDAFKMDDGRWSVSAGYRLEQAERQAVFYFDNRGRFCVTGNDEARWMVGEQSEDPAAELSEAEDNDTEPTLKLAGAADEMALLRSVETGTSTATVTDAPAKTSAESATPRQTDPDAEDGEVSTDEPDDDTAAPPVTDDDTAAAAVTADDTEPGAATDEVDGGSELAAATTEPSQLDLLYDILGSDGYAEDSIRVYDGLSDATAVPDVADGAWASQPDEDVPAEPEPESPAQAEPEVQAQPEAQAQPEQTEAEQHDAVDTADNAVEAQPVADVETDGAAAGDASADDAPPEPAAPGAVEVESARADGSDTAASAPEETLLADGAAQDALPGADGEDSTDKPKPKPKKRKRASVPSWDEIMFGSPKSK